MDRLEHQNRISELQAEIRVRPFLHEDEKDLPLEMRRILRTANAMMEQDRMVQGIIGDEIDRETK